MQITIRKRTIGEGKQSLYLDFWPPVQKSEGGETRRESLGLYITTNPKTSFERRQNKATLMAAERIRAERQIEYQDNKILKKSSETIEELLKYEASKRKKASTKKSWVSAGSYIIDYFGKTKTVSSLTVRECQKFVEHMWAIVNKGELNQGTASNYVHLFRSALNGAFTEEIIQKRLTAHFGRIPPPEPNATYLTKEEADRLVMLDPDPYFEYHRAVVIALMTGVRRGDLTRIQWKHIIDTEKMSILDFTMQKTGHRLRVPISSRVRKIMGEREDPDERVVKIPYQSLDYALDVLAERAGISQKVHFHMLRHTFAVLQLAHGADIYTVSKMLGHRTILTTEKFYAKVLDETFLEAANRLSEFFLNPNLTSRQQTR